jgi:hypothetical protein
MAEWLALETTIYENKKVMNAADILDENPDAVAAAFIALLVYARRHQPDGDLSGLRPLPLKRALRWLGKCAAADVIEAMVEVGFLTPDHRVDKFAERHSGLLAAMRQQRYRQRKSVTSEPDASPQRQLPVTSPLPTRHDKTRQDKEPTSIGGKPPALDGDFEVWWAAYGRVGSKADAHRLYLYWREHGASAEQLTSAAAAYIAHCGKTSCSLQHAKTFLAKTPNRWEEWAANEEHGDMAPPATPSNPTTDDRRPTCVVCAGVMDPDDMLDGVFTDKGWRHARCPKEAP